MVLPDILGTPCMYTLKSLKGDTYQHVCQSNNLYYCAMANTTLIADWVYPAKYAICREEEG